MPVDPPLGNGFKKSKIVEVLISVPMFVAVYATNLVGDKINLLENMRQNPNHGRTGMRTKNAKRFTEMETGRFIRDSVIPDSKNTHRTKVP